MNKFKVILVFSLYCLIGQSGFSLDMPSSHPVIGSVVRTACIYPYSDKQKELTEYFSPGNELTDKQVVAELTRIQPIEVKLVERELGDTALEQLLPFSNMIYGLKLEENFLTNDSLSILSKFTQLRYLALSNNRFNNPSLTCLSNLEHLKRLILTNNRIDTKEIGSIREKMPKTVIVF